MPHRKSVGRRAVLAVTLAASLVGVLTGCNPPVEAPAAPAVAVVAAHDDTELAPALSSGERAELRALASDPDRTEAHVSVLAAGDPAVEDVDLEPRRPNGQVERGPRRAALIEERLAALDAAIDRAAARSRNADLLGALGAVLRLGATDVHVLSDGLSDTDPFDMRVTGWDVDPVQLAADLRVAHALPDATGRSIVLSGLGRTTGRQPPLDEAAQQSLRAQWTAVCAATGARCAVDDGPRPARPDVAAPRPGPVVPVDRVRTVATPAGGQEVSLPSSVLFVPGSCALRDRAAAAAVVDDVVARLRAGATAAVSGRTAPVGPGDGVDLATCRAGAVADLIVDGGAPRTALTRVAGDGSLADPPSASRDAEGRPDPRTYPGLRRVVLDLTPTTRS